MQGLGSNEDLIALGMTPVQIKENQNSSLEQLASEANQPGTAEAAVLKAAAENTHEQTRNQNLPLHAAYLH